MFSVRSALLIFVLPLGVSLFASSASAQQGYEFGIRFQPVNFRPVNFNGFSFQQTSFRPQNTQPIPFERITFPALNSRAVRRASSRERRSTLERRTAPIRVSRRRDAVGERTRLAFDSPSLLRQRGNSSQSTQISQNPYYSRTSPITLRSRRDVVQVANERSPRTSDRREVLARRITDVRESRVR
jgi:hypothetical protein